MKNWYYACIAFISCVLRIALFLICLFLWLFIYNFYFMKNVVVFLDVVRNDRKRRKRNSIHCALKNHICWEKVVCFVVMSYVYYIYFFSYCFFRIVNCVVLSKSSRRKRWSYKYYAVIISTDCYLFIYDYFISLEFEFKFFIIFH
jgi:predicted membrane protein